MLLWIVNMFIIAFGLCRLLLCKDPILPADSKVSVELHRWRRQAEFNISKNDYSQALCDLSLCLRFFSRNLNYLPEIKMDIFFVTLRQLLRQILHRFHVNKLLTIVGKRFVKESDRNLGEISAMELSMLYQRMLSLRLSQESKESSIFIALSAVNYAEAAGESMPKAMLAEIYVNAALCFKQSMIPFVHKFYLNRARNLLATCNVPQKLKWIMNDDAIKFLVSQKWNYGPIKESNFTVQNNTSDPLSFAARAYREQLISQGLKLLSGTANDAHASAVLDISRKIMNSVQVDLCISNGDRIGITSKHF